ncbi:ATP-dependent protease ATPase subunit HslU [bacterium]|nr:ATP-dependent protease ATPase subunit HslU [bacterium]MBU1025234.1 ATP-dependent protease ATPase subunit HslU [bacterium]
MNPVNQKTFVSSLTPREIVKQLDLYIVGQDNAKKAVAIALRNRFRRQQVTGEIKDEIMPKNILMIGPTGVGKTEIARRLARLAESPFIKVEATKFTEIGYMGRDVEGMIRDLMEKAVAMVKTARMEEVEELADNHAVETLLDLLQPYPKKIKIPASHQDMPGEESLFQGKELPPAATREEQFPQITRIRARYTEQILAGEMDEDIVEMEVEDAQPRMVEIFSSAGIEEMGLNIQEMFGDMAPRKKKKRKLPIREARVILRSIEAQKLVDMDAIIADARMKCEESGIIFVDEIDKVVGSDRTTGPDVSREGVQRDILPLVEGATVITKYGPIRTHHMLFIGAGAFHISKPSDLIPEFQGRFPIRVELDSLNADDFRRILVEPKNALTRQYQALLKTENVNLTFTDDGINELSETAFKVNEETENIGARRLHTVLEKVLEDILFDAPSKTKKVVVNTEYVKKHVGNIATDRDLSRYIL